MLAVGGVTALRAPPFADADLPAPLAASEDVEPRPTRASSRSSASPGASSKPIWDIPLPVPGLLESAAPATPPPELRGLQTRFVTQVRRRDLKGALTTLEEMAELSKDAIKESEVREEVVELSQRVMQLPGDEPTRMFAVLSSKAGTAGIDVLYYLVTAKGSSRASKEALRYLEDPKVLARGSQGMQIAWALRSARCEDKKALFARAGEHGDQRTIGQLHELNQACGRRNRGCCYPKDPELEAALAALKARGLR